MRELTRNGFLRFGLFGATAVAGLGALCETSTDKKFKRLNESLKPSYSLSNIPDELAASDSWMMEDPRRELNVAKAEYYRLSRLLDFLHNNPDVPENTGHFVKVPLTWDTLKEPQMKIGLDRYNKIYNQTFNAIDIPEGIFFISNGVYIRDRQLEPWWSPDDGRRLFVIDVWDPPHTNPFEFPNDSQKLTSTPKSPTLPQEPENTDTSWRYLKRVLFVTIPPIQTNSPLITPLSRNEVILELAKLQHATEDNLNQI